MWNPLATSLALYPLMEPFGFCLTLKTHLQPMAYLWDAKGIKDQVSSLNRALYSSVMVVFHTGISRAALALGSSTRCRKAVGRICLNIPDFDLVFIGWIDRDDLELTGLESEIVCYGTGLEELLRSVSTPPESEESQNEW